MFEFIRLQFRLGRLTGEQVRAMAPRWITGEEAQAILEEGR